MSHPGEPTTRASVVAVGSMFFINGAVIFSWIPRIADIRDQLGVTNAQLGTALLGMGFGGFAGSLILPRLMGRFRTRHLLIAGGTAQAITLPLIAFMPGAIALGVLLAFIGFIDLVTDMSMNTQGVMVQERFGRSIMQRLHGGWSMGSFAGTLVAWLAISAGVSVRVHLMLVSCLLFLAVLAVRNSLLPNDNTPGDAARGSGASPPSSVPVPATRRKVPAPAIALGVMAIGVAIVESLPNNWASVAMRDVFGARRGLRGVASIVFAGSMLIGRLGGDHVLERIGEKRLLVGALCTALVGGAIMTSTPVLGIGLLGFGIWGLGISVVFPQMYALAATMPGLAAGVGLAAMAVGQRLGFMMEPAVTGRVSDHLRLRPAIGLMLVVSAALLVLSTVLRTSAARRLHPATGLLPQ